MTAVPGQAFICLFAWITGQPFTGAAIFSRRILSAHRTCFSLPVRADTMSTGLIFFVIFAYSKNNRHEKHV